MKHSYLNQEENIAFCTFIVFLPFCVWLVSFYGGMDRSLMMSFSGNTHIFMLFLPLFLHAINSCDAHWKDSIRQSQCVSKLYFIAIFSAFFRNNAVM